MSGFSNNGGVGPCGACKFLRRKCVKGCIFAPYFDSEQGALHFAAVHKVFGASNASKLLLRIPANKRLDAVVSLCYEALSRVRDPVYGCVGHIFTLQQQVINLQTELAYVQARVSIMQRCLPPQYPQQLTNVVNPQCSSQETLMQLDQPNSQLVDQDEQTSMELSAATSDYPLGEVEGIDEDDELEMFAREVVAKYLPSVKFS